MSIFANHSRGRANNLPFWPSRWVFFVVGLPICLLYARNAIAQNDESGYTVQGIVEIKSLRAKDREHKIYIYDEQAIDFEIHVKDCRWLMKLGTHDANVYDYRVVSFDGEDSYLLLSYETRQKLNAVQGRPVLNVGDGAVRKGEVPLFNFADEAGALWIAFASGCHFAAHEHQELLPVPFCYIGLDSRTLTTSDNPSMEKATFRLNRQRPFIPTDVAYYVPDVAKIMRSKSSDLQSGIFFTNVVYEALAFSEISGFYLPREAVISTFRPDPREFPKIKPQLYQEIHIRTTNVVASVSLRSFRPELPGKTIVSDERFNKGITLNLEYFTTNDWLSEETVKNSRGYKQARISAEVTFANSRRETKSSLFVRTLIILTLITIPLLLWRFSSSSKTSKH